MQVLIFSFLKNTKNLLQEQKYLEKPLLYQGRKFDIRLWVMSISGQEEDIFIFNCSKVVNQPISRLSYINNSITLNGQPLTNLEKDKLVRIIGENIQNQKDTYLSYPHYYLKNCDLIKESNSLIIEGENSETNLASKNSYLLFYKY